MPSIKSAFRPKAHSSHSNNTPVASMIAFNAVGRMSALFLVFILYANNIMYSNAQPTIAPTMNTGAQNYTVTQVS